jgi:hypothetical protein
MLWVNLAILALPALLLYFSYQLIFDEVIVGAKPITVDRLCEITDPTLLPHNYFKLEKVHLTSTLYAGPDLPSTSGKSSPDYYYQGIEGTDPLLLIKSCAPQMKHTDLKGRVAPVTVELQTQLAGAEALAGRTILPVMLDSTQSELGWVRWTQKFRPLAK